MLTDNIYFSGALFVGGIVTTGIGLTMPSRSRDQDRSPLKMFTTAVGVALIGTSLYGIGTYAYEAISSEETSINEAVSAATQQFIRFQKGLENISSTIQDWRGTFLDTKQQNNTSIIQEKLKTFNLSTSSSEDLQSLCTRISTSLRQAVASFDTHWEPTMNHIAKLPEIVANSMRDDPKIRGEIDPKRFEDLISFSQKAIVLTDRIGDELKGFDQFCCSMG